MAQVRLNEPLVTLLNPCPDMTLGELMSKAGVVLPRKQEAEKAFDIEFRLSSGKEAEWIELKAGEMLQIQESLAWRIYKRRRQRGIVIIGQGEDPNRAAIRGLTETIGFWNEKGQMQLIDQRARHGYSPEEMKRLKKQHATLHINVEREKACQAQLEHHQREINLGQEKKAS